MSTTVIFHDRQSVEARRAQEREAAIETLIALAGQCSHCHGVGEWRGQLETSGGALEQVTITCGQCRATGLASRIDRNEAIGALLVELASFQLPVPLDDLERVRLERAS